MIRNTEITCTVDGLSLNVINWLKAQIKSSKLKAHHMIVPHHGRMDGIFTFYDANDFYRVYQDATFGLPEYSTRNQLHEIKEELLSADADYIRFTDL